MVMSLQSSMAVKDTECLDGEHRLSMATHYIETQAKKMNLMHSEIIMYQSFIKSKGLELPTSTNISGEMPAVTTMETSDMNKFSK